MPRPQDTLAAYQKIEKLRQQALAGGRFRPAGPRQRAKTPRPSENGGKLGYFTAMQMVYPFESAAYKTPVGQVSQPIRTRFGYHIIKVNDKRAAQGEIKVAHLMVRVNASAAKADSLTAKKKIDELYSPPEKGRKLGQARGPVLGRCRLGRQRRRAAALRHRPHDSLV